MVPPILITELQGMHLRPGKLSRKIVGMLLVFFLVATLAIALTLAISWQLEGVAAAINDAGSQRMRSYRIAHLMGRGVAVGRGQEVAQSAFTGHDRRGDEAF